MGVEIPDYPANNLPAKSNKTKEKKVEKVISGTVRTSRKPVGKRFMDLFLGDDISNVKEYMIYDRIIPGVKEMLVSGFEMVLFGDTRRRSRYDTKASYVSYNKMYGVRDSRRVRDTREDRRSTTLDLEEYIFETKGEAIEVLDTLTELIDVYGQASVTDFYDAIGVTGNFTDCNYGWTELGDAHIRRVRGGGYALDMPRPIVLR